MKSFLKRLSIFLVVFLLIGFKIYAKDDLEALKKKIEDISGKITKANLANDLDTMYSYYADDVIYMPNYHPMVQGKDIVKQKEEESRKNGMKIHSVNFTPLKVFDCGDYVCEVGTYEFSLTLPGTTNPIVDSGKYMILWEKQSDDSLKIKVEIWNTNCNPWAVINPQKVEEDKKPKSEKK